MTCENCFHLESCAYVRPILPACDEFVDKTQVVDALDKQVPKKPKGIIRWAKDNFANGKCSVCDRFVTSVMCYCDGCGTKLDWSEEK